MGRGWQYPLVARLRTDRSRDDATGGVAGQPCIVIVVMSNLVLVLWSYVCERKKLFSTLGKGGGNEE